MTFAAPPDGGAPEPLVEIVRSRRRRRTVSAYREGDRTIVHVPAGLSRTEEQRLVTDMVARLAKRDARTRVGDADLAERAQALSERYLGGRAKPTNVRWVTNQNSRWGSCTPAEGTIRLSHKLRRMPAWVIDYVLVHELAHLLVPGHGPRFWELVELYPRTERARGFLEGVALAAGLELSPDVDGDEAPGDLLDDDVQEGPAA
ncbi:MAG: hypothetical protein QOI76_424 [Frankiales bacterium]|jgi:predicted metal-dependent hydrolase|nr:hypothetical protein [Frankiales bacterium]